jgi:hypothetical protein
MEIQHPVRSGNGLFSPVLGPLMQNRWIIVLLAALTSLQVGLAATDIAVWQCPLRSALGVICPGCGLSRAMALFAQGHWRAAIELHAFAPVFFGFGIFLAVTSFLPARLQQLMACQTAAVERRTGIVALLILSVLAYWILRITYLI